MRLPARPMIGRLNPSVSSRIAWLGQSLFQRDPVKIAVQPVGGTLELGDGISIWVLASGHGTLSYQW